MRGGFSYFWEICSHHLTNNHYQIGGVGQVVKIDESLVAKHKYNRGHNVDQRWVFGGICPATGEGFLQLIPNKSAATLLPLIQEPGSIIQSDGNPSYNNTVNLPVNPLYQHLVVIHDQNCVDPITRACTNHMECYWKNKTRVGQRGAINYFYTLHDQILAEVDTVKYLGVWISNDLSWTPHVDYVTKKGNQKLGFLRRNLRGAPTPSKSLAYTSLVRSGLEYAAPIWDPYKIKDTNKIEAIQRKAARWAKSAYSPHTSVTGLLQDLGWSGLGDRRMILRLTLLYKIYFHQVGIEHTEVGIIPNPRPSRKNSFQILRPRSRKSPYTNSLILRTIPEWNNLPDSTIMAGSASDFKNRFSATQP
ncbi:hypothetical protein EGW08_000871 [Elysia chlorotica]|uniref:ISXO2-like transposase domain-containing protein n=1 Tax=Elysia chlorotica TaxID=188477 RepID=A0A3S1A0K2_ELYCH|nr:hypothetical protein EGW08_000871 [Elysia chlorotica]